MNIHKPAMNDIPGKEEAEAALAPKGHDLDWPAFADAWRGKGGLPHALPGDGGLRLHRP
mgnify:CR=1 FL=1